MALNGEALELANMIQDLGHGINTKIDIQHNDLTDKISKLSSDFAAHKAATELNVKNLQDDHTDIKKQQDSDRIWHRVQTGIVIPVMGVLHQVASHYGWIK
jgi:hypothetical protein